ncbi:MAG TPA: FG-GAP-like repeat-containing protein, partial [Pyrinomonadaceae bacterium]
GKILIAEGGAGVLLYRLNRDGTRDTSFSTPFVPFSASIQRRTEIRSIAVQPDDKILVGGQLITGSASSPSLSTLIRLNPDGSRDTTFPLVAGIGTSIYTHDIAVQPDGKIVFGGNFSQLNGQPVQYLARVNPNGAIDNTFNASPPATVLELDLQSDGKIVFTSGSSVLRVNADGSADAGFSPAAFDNNGVLIDLLAALQVLPSGKILVGGNFTSVNGAPRYRIARLNANGSPDAGFNLPNGANNVVYDFSLQSDGKILVSGAFTRLGGQPGIGAARLIETSANARMQFDFDGDGRADISVFRQGNWYLLNSASGFTAVQFGLSSDTPAPADYDGDGKTDVAVFRNGVWYLQQSTNGFAGVQFGQTNDVPVSSAYVP